MDTLLLEFRSRILSNRTIKQRNFVEEPKNNVKYRIENANYWNGIAKILLNFDKYESEEAALKQCFEVLEKGIDLKDLKDTMIVLNNKSRQIVDFLDAIVGSKTTSTDGTFVIYYLQKMYDNLDYDDLPYVDENLRTEMMKRLELVETINY